MTLVDQDQIQMLVNGYHLSRSHQTQTQSHPTPDPDTTDSGSGGFDYDLLLELGLGMMAAGAVPGSTIAGSLGQGGLSALQSRREADALRRKEDLENRKLAAAIKANEQDYSAAIAALSRDQLEDQLGIVDDEITSIYDQLEHISENAQLNGISVTGRLREELEDTLIRLEINKALLHGELGIAITDVSVPEDTLQN